MARYHDERLARLRLADGELNVPALAVDDDSRDNVRRIEAVTHLRLRGINGLTLRVHFDDNPCCDGPESRSQTRLVVFVDAPSGVREVLSVITARENSSHSDAPEVGESTQHAGFQCQRSPETA